jgi:hypothetical protein
MKVSSCNKYVNAFVLIINETHVEQFNYKSAFEFWFDVIKKTNSITKLKFY